MAFQPGDQVGIIDYYGLVAGGPFTFVGQSPFDGTLWRLRTLEGEELHIFKRNVFKWAFGLERGDPVPIPLTRVVNTKRTNQIIREGLHSIMPTGPGEHPAVNLIRSYVGVPSPAPGAHNLGNEGRWKKVSASAGVTSSSAGVTSSSAGGGASSSASSTNSKKQRRKKSRRTRRRQ